MSRGAGRGGVGQGGTGENRAEGQRGDMELQASTMAFICCLLVEVTSTLGHRDPHDLLS